MPNPYLRDPRRWAVMVALTVAVIGLEVLFTIIWPSWGPFLILPIVALGIGLRIWMLRRRFRRHGVPAELQSWMDERAQRRHRGRSQ